MITQGIDTFNEVGMGRSMVLTEKRDNAGFVLHSAVILCNVVDANKATLLGLLGIRQFFVCKFPFSLVLFLGHILRLVGCLVGCLVRLVGRICGCLVGLVGRIFRCFLRLVGCLVCRLVGCLVCRICRLVGRICGCLVGCLVCFRRVGHICILGGGCCFHFQWWLLCLFLWVDVWNGSSGC